MAFPRERALVRRSADAVPDRSIVRAICRSITPVGRPAGHVLEAAVGERWEAHEQAVAMDRTGPLSRGVNPGFIRGPNPWRSRAPLSARRLTWLQESPPLVPSPSRFDCCDLHLRRPPQDSSADAVTLRRPPPRPCTGEHGHAHHTGPGQRGHGWGQPARSPLSPIPDQFPSSSGRSPRRRLHARIRSPTGRLEPRVSGAGGTVFGPDRGFGPQSSREVPCPRCQGSGPRMSLCR
jgi:hypothetical protein